jgi:hypothetical protein
VTETTESTPEGPDPTIDTLASERGLQTLDEMLPAVRAFYGNSSKA